MTTETTSLSGWDRALIAARWCRDKAAEFIVKFWLYVILWTVVAIAFSVLLYIDGKFSRGLAEGLDDIDPFSFQAMGWAYRLFAAAFLMAGAVCIVKGIKGALTFRLLGVFASVIVCLHAFGFGFQALQDRRDDAMAVREVVALQANNSAEQIALLREQIETTRADRDARVTRLQTSIDGIVSDGLNNDQLADDYRKDQTKAEEDAKAKIDAAEREISRLASEGNTAQQNVATITADEKPWPALYVGMAQLATWSKEPTDWAIYLCGVGFIIGWVLLAESLVIFLPERIYLMHLKDAEQGETQIAYSDTVPEGFVRVEFTEDEYAQRESLWAQYQDQQRKKAENRKRQAEDKAPTGSPLRLDNKGWKREMKGRIQAAFDEGKAPEEIAAHVGLTWPEYENIVNRMFNKKSATKYLGQPDDEAPDPRAAVTLGDYMPEPEPAEEEPEPPVAMADSPQTEEPEPEAEDEPAPEAGEYGVTLWEPPANDDPQDKDAA